MQQFSLSRVELLELDIDVRLASLWREVERREGVFSLEFIGALMRACYGRGYSDSLSEAEPGQLCREHGYKIPARP